MFLTLPDSKLEVQVIVQYSPCRLASGIPTVHPRSTTVALKDPKSSLVIVSGEAKCSVNDNFCRLAGRKLALRRLFENQRVQESRSPLSKADRRAIFNAVCPKFANVGTHQ